MEKTVIIENAKYEFVKREVKLENKFALLGYGL